MPSIPPEEVRVLDINSSYLGVRAVQLMERAGAAVAKYVMDNHPPGSRVALICGKGNNGGDGFVAARYLSESMQAHVFLAEPQAEVLSDIAKANLGMVSGDIRRADAADVKQYDVLVDAMLGVGLKGRPREPYASLIKLLNGSRRPVVSVDVPSGWPSELQVRPDATITFHAPKVGMTRANSGMIVVTDIGIPKEAGMYCGPGEFALLPPRRKDAHKGDAGRVLVIGGGPYTGAPAFTGMAAMRSGIDLAVVATPEASALPVSIYSPNIIVRPLPGDILEPAHIGPLLELSEDADVVAIGPGLGDAKETMEAVRGFVSRVRKPLVVDADAIGACGAKPKVLKGKTGVITPHAGEFKKLTGRTVPAEDMDKKVELVEDAASRLGLTVVLKGAVDVVSDGDYTRLNRTGNPAMTVGGTGDVLTGVVAGILAQKATPFAAGRIGAFTAGLAGDLAFEEKSFGLLATDVIEKIPLVLRRYILGGGL